MLPNDNYILKISDLFQSLKEIQGKFNDHFEYYLLINVLVSSILGFQEI